MKSPSLCTAALFLLALPAAGSGLSDVTVGPNGVEARIELAGGLEADLEIGFEQVVGLYSGAGSLGLSASAIDPTDLDLLARLPDAQLVSIPAAFPVMLSIEPPASGPLSFTGAVSVNLHTHNLTYTANSPLRLFAADAGGPFYDITQTMGMGSYRVGGSKGGFSEFVIVADLRAATDVIDEKFEILQATLDDNCLDIDEDVHEALQASLDAAWSWYSAGDALSARDEIGEFLDTVKTESGAAIPNVWRSARDLVNVAGELQEGASTLRFSLSLFASS